jgi:hypothetical protein
MIKTVSPRFAVTLALGAGLIAAAPAAASPSASQDGIPAAASSQAGSNDDDRRVCVREQLSGTRVHATICKTRREWRAEAAAAGRD